jgi:5'-3' exonuclease
MAGDSADNIPGITGIGKKYAAEAIRQTRSMRELFRRAAEGSLANLKPATQAKIAAGLAEYEASFKLVELRCDLQCAASLDDYRVLAIPPDAGAGESKAAESFTGETASPAPATSGAA